MQRFVVRSQHLAFALLCVLLLHASHGSREHSAASRAKMVHQEEYVLVSQPNVGAVVYFEVDAVTRAVKGEARPLIASGLHEPFGIAVDQKRNRLFVADARSRKVFMYGIIHSGGEDGTARGLAIDDDSYTVAESVTPRWVAVDEHTGSLFLTDEQRDAVSEVSSEAIDAIEAAGGGAARGARPKIIYTGDHSHVDRPGGIAADGYRVFWANKARGRVRGTVVEGLEVAKGSADHHVPGEVRVLGHNVDKAYGVCLVRGGVYFTGESKRFYGARLAAHGSEEPTVISDQLRAPRGCAWDGDGSIYVADKAAGAVYSFPVGFHSANHAISRLISVRDPYGVAVFRPRPVARSSVMGLLLRSASEPRGMRFLTALVVVGLGLTLAPPLS